MTSTNPEGIAGGSPGASGHGVPGSRALVLAHLAGEPVERLPAMPITMMFAARVAGVRYIDYCRDHRVLARAQLAVADRFGFDHVSCISDPAREASDLGARVEWFDEQPPAIDESVALLAAKPDLAALRRPDPRGGGRMTDRLLAVEVLRAADGPPRLVEGWVEGPCAEAADLRGINTLMLDFLDDPSFVQDLFGFTTEIAMAFARAQVDAGADIIGVGDAAASLVGPEIYEEVVVPHEQRLIDHIHAVGGRARLHICGNMRRSVGPMSRLGADIVDLDSLVPLDEARAAAGPDQVLLGNLNPVTELLTSTPAEVARAIERCHRQAGSRYIVGAGCEIPAATPPENVDALVAYARGARP